MILAMTVVLLLAARGLAAIVSDAISYCKSKIGVEQLGAEVVVEPDVPVAAVHRVIVPKKIVVTMKRGQKYHSEMCHEVRDRPDVKTYEPCSKCEVLLKVPLGVGP